MLEICESNLDISERFGEIKAQLRQAGLGSLDLDIVSDRHLLVSGRLN